MLIRSERPFASIAGCVLLSGACFSSLGCSGKVDSPRAQQPSDDLIDASSLPETGSSHPVVTPSDPDGSIDGSDDRDHASPDVADGAGCTPSAAPLWHSTDTGFTYSSSGGYADILVDAGCVWLKSEYDFALVDGVGSLTETSCGYNGPVNRSATLTADQTAQIVAKLNALRTVCNMNCGADAPTVTLTIGATTYNSDFYSGCGTAAPYVSFDALSGLEYAADTILNAACPADDGGPPVGTCTTASPDGG
jgi:hypothetical protein